MPMWVWEKVQEVLWKTMSTKVLIETLNIGIKNNNFDAVCFKIPADAKTAMVTTKNRYAAAPVILSRKNILKSQPRYILVNSGNANACTGKIGLSNSLKCTNFISQKFDCKSSQVLLFSTGIIGNQLPIENIEKKINEHKFSFKSSWKSASKAIMTTDKFNKYISKSFLINRKKITINAICKGAGMIEPNMATMLAFISVDANLSKKLLNKLLKQVNDTSFNAISVDGEMSTNDSVVLISTGENKKIDFNDSSNYKKLSYELSVLCQDLAKMIIKDGEGSTKIITINVHSSKSKSQAKLVAYSLANSNLIKTAMFGADPNWGRIIARLGSLNNINYSPEKVDLHINKMLIFTDGVQSNECNLKLLNKSMKKKEVVIDIALNCGSSDHSVITSDLSHEYVHINSAYTT